MIVVGWLGAAVALAAPKVEGEVVSHGRLRARLADPQRSPNEIVLLYGGEIEGSLEPCGCEAADRGTLARAVRYRDAVARRDEPLLVFAGGWLNATADTDLRLLPEVRVADRAVIDGFEQAGVVAANLGYRDHPYLASEAIPPWAVSANLVGGTAVTTHRIVPVGELRVAITGVTGAGLPHLQPEGTIIADPVASLADRLPFLTAHADVVVVLAYEVGAAAERIAGLPGVDVLVEADGFRERYAPFVEGEAVWVRATPGLARLGELRLSVEEGRVVAAVDRSIAMDGAIRPDRWQRRLAEQTREALGGSRSGPAR
jgi:hypothetical protein